MSSTACWKCAVEGHHHRDCVADVDEVTANRNRKLAKKVHLYERNPTKKKTAKEKEKFEQKLAVRHMSILPREFLRKYCELELDVIAEVEFAIKEIGKPSVSNLDRDLQESLDAEEKLRCRLSTMRDVVSHGKNYIIQMRKTSTWDFENQMFADTINYLDEVRQTLFCTCGKLTADLKELLRKLPVLQGLLESASIKIEQCRSVIGERSPSPSAWQELLVTQQEVEAILNQADVNLHLLKRFADCGEIELQCVLLRDALDQVQKERVRKILEVVDNSEPNTPSPEPATNWYENTITSFRRTWATLKTALY